MSPCMRFSAARGLSAIRKMVSTRQIEMIEDHHGNL